MTRGIGAMGIPWIAALVVIVWAIVGVLSLDEYKLLREALNHKTAAS